MALHRPVRPRLNGPAPYPGGIVLELRQLRYFAAVARERNFTRAAELMNIAQPPVSRQIQALEDEMGATLVERGAVSPVIMSTRKGDRNPELAVMPWVVLEMHRKAGLTFGA